LGADDGGRVIEQRDEIEDRGVRCGTRGAVVLPAALLVLVFADGLEVWIRPVKGGQELHP
jgi:hypothetical protein